MSTYYVDITTGNDDDNGSTEDLAWQTLAKVADMVGADDTVHIKSSAEYIVEDANSKAMELATSGTISNPITLEGYTDSPGDGGMVTINGTANGLANGIHGTVTYYIIKNITVKNMSDTGFELGASNILINCIADNCTDIGIQITASAVIKCETKNGGNNGIYAVGDSVVVASKSHGNTGKGIWCKTIVFCTSYDNDDTEIYNNSGITLFLNNTADGKEKAVHGFHCPGYLTIALNNIAYDCDYGIEAGAGQDMVFSDHNLFFNNTNDHYNIDSDMIGNNNITGNDPSFVSEGSDYSLTSGSPALGTGIDAGE